MIRNALIGLCLIGLLLSWHIESPEWPIWQALIMCLFASAIVGWVRGRFEIQWSWAFLPMLAIAAWPAGQLLFGGTVYRNDTFVELLRWTTYAVIFALGFWCFQHRDEVNLLLRVLITFSLLVAAIATMQHFTDNGKVFWIFTSLQPTGTSMGPFPNRDHYASFIALIIPMAILRAFDEPDRRLTYSLAAAAMYASVVAGASRAGSLLVTTEVLLCLFLITIRPGNQESPAWHRHRFSLGSLFLVAALVAVVGWEPLWARFQDTDPYKGRRELVLSTTALIREKPLSGHGLGSWVHVYPAQAVFDPGQFANAAHNDWLQWASDGGIPYAFLFFILFCVSVIVCWYVPWAIGIPAVFLHCTVDFPIEGSRYFPAVLFLIFGAALSRARAKRLAR